MAAGSLSYEILPKIPILGNGTLLETKNEICGTDAAGINEADENFEFGALDEIIPAGTTCMWVEDQQFMAANKENPMSAWIRCHLIAGEKIVWYTLICERRRIWEFKTFRARKRLVEEALGGQFKVLQKPISTEL